MTDLTPPIFDGHNDILLKLWRAEQEGRSPEALFRDGAHGHLDLPRMKAGGFCGGFFALFAPSAGMSMDMSGDSYDLPLPPLMAQEEALAANIAQAGILLRLERLGHLRILRRAADLPAAIEAGEVAAILHLEGADCIDREFRALDVLQGAGLRSLGPVWSRDNIWAHGAPFRFPSSPDTGPGLTEAGRELVRQCDARRIMIDLSHLTEAGFWDVAEVSGRPLVATHSNVHALCPHARNLTDRQLDAVKERGGMVGVNLATAFLRADGKMDAEETLDALVAHFVYLVERMGEDCVGLGSDFDGARIPTPIKDVAGLPALRAALQGAGFDGAVLEKLCWKNWARVLGETWGA